MRGGEEGLLVGSLGLGAWDREVSVGATEGTVSVQVRGVGAVCALLALLVLAGCSSSSPPPPVGVVADSGFRPGPDGFTFQNYGNTLSDGAVPTNLTAADVEDAVRQRGVRRCRHRQVRPHPRGPGLDGSDEPGDGRRPLLRVLRGRRSGLAEQGKHQHLWGADHQRPGHRQQRHPAEHHRRGLGVPDPRLGAGQEDHREPQPDPGRTGEAAQAPSRPIPTPSPSGSEMAPAATPSPRTR